MNVRPHSPIPGPLAIAWIAGCTYFVLLGGNLAAVGNSGLYLINAALIGAAILGAVWVVRRRNDHVDLAVVAALLLFLLTCLFSDFRRQSLDAAYSATAFTAFFLVGRRIMADPHAVRWLIHALAVVGIGLGLGFLMTWGAEWAIWRVYVGEWPPLGLYFATNGFGYRNDVPLLLALLAAPVWMDRRAMPRGVAVIGLAAIASVVLMSGARMVWISLTIAIAAAAIVHYRRRGMTPPRLAGRFKIALLVIGVIAVSASAPLIVSRVGQLDTLGGRGLLWGGTIAVWAEDVLWGAGPGTFPLTLQLTDYPETISFLPEHADNAILQLSAESGLVGVGALLLAMALVGTSLLRARPSPWVAYTCIMFAANCMTANPTENSFHVLPALAALASGLALPPPSLPKPSKPRRRPYRGVLGVTAALFVVVSISPVGGRIAYDLAAEANGRDDTARSDQLLSVAVALDPARSIYWRERGLLRVAQESYGKGITDLIAAANLAPTDTATLRSAMFAAMQTNNYGVALALARRAADATSSETDLLALGWAASLSGRGDEGLAAFVEAIRMAPWITGADGWDLLAPGTHTVADIAAVAAHEGLTQPNDLSQAQQLVWLALVAGEPNLLPDQAATLPEQSVQYPLVQLALCRAAAGVDVASTVTAANVNHPDYWAGILMNEAVIGSRDGETRNLAYVAAPYTFRPITRPDAFLRDPIRDQWLYGVYPLQRDEFRSLLPTTDGLARWIEDPLGIANRIPRSLINACDYSRQTN